jgi:uncharacterized iron-regulated membrane protein
MSQRQLKRRARKVHRWLVPIAALPLLITAATGSLYSLLLEQEIDAFWLLKIHTGNFGVLNLQPIYPMLLGALTVIVTVSGAAMLWRPSR